MDCQGLMEYCLKKVGVQKNWKGSNAMWRDMLWRGTPEECRKRFGKIPVGAWLFILLQDGGEAGRGYLDDMGNASHVGVYTGTGDGAVHASQSRGCVAASTFRGKTIPNGGWNMVGLCRELDYGLGDLDETETEREGEDTETLASVHTFNGQGVNLRAVPSTAGKYLGKIPEGETLVVAETEGEWCRVRWGKLQGYVKSEFLEGVGATCAEDTDLVDLPSLQLPRQAVQLLLQWLAGAAD